LAKPPVKYVCHRFNPGPPFHISKYARDPGVNHNAPHVLIISPQGTPVMVPNRSVGVISHAQSRCFITPITFVWVTITRNRYEFSYGHSLHFSLPQAISRPNTNRLLFIIVSPKLYRPRAFEVVILVKRHLWPTICYYGDNRDIVERLSWRENRLIRNLDFNAR